MIEEYNNFGIIYQAIRNHDKKSGWIENIKGTYKNNEP